MNKDNIKKSVLFYVPYESKGIEEFLEEKAKAGWILESVNRFVFKFKKDKPKTLKYAVDILKESSVFDHKETDASKVYREYCEKSGWNYICECGRFQIYCKDLNEDLTPIHTDEKEKYKIVLKSLTFPTVLISLILALNVFQFFYIFNSGSGLTDIVVYNAGIVGTIFIIILNITLILLLLDIASWYIKNKIRFLHNKEILYRNYKQLKIKNILIKTFLSLWGISILSIISFSILESDYSAPAIMIISVCLLILIISSIYYYKNKTYSRNTNKKIVLLTISVCMIICTISIFVFAFKDSKNSINELNQNDILLLKDFNYADNNIKAISHSSVLASIDTIYSKDENNQLMYTIFESKIEWLANRHLNELLYSRDRYGIRYYKTMDIEDVKVYTTKSKGNYIFVSDNKVVEVSNHLQEVEEEEFIETVYKKLFN